MTNERPYFGLREAVSDELKTAVTEITDYAENGTMPPDRRKHLRLVLDALEEANWEIDEALALVHAPQSDNDGGRASVVEEVKSLLSIQRSLVHEKLCCHLGQLEE